MAAPENARCQNRVCHGGGGRATFPIMKKNYLLALAFALLVGCSSVPTKPQPANTLTKAEKAAGWKLLFDGQSFTGWHNFKMDGVRPGWQVKDGALVCVDPHNAGDIVTTGQIRLVRVAARLQYFRGRQQRHHVPRHGRRQRGVGDRPGISTGGQRQGRRPAVRCGWLYALYQPPIDPTTGKTLDATKPVGEWNHVRLLISPEKCVHEINGVKYFEYVLGSDDFNARVAKSKFHKMPFFAKATSGFIALQGDHGSVSFRNIKIRPLADKE